MNPKVITYIAVSALVAAAGGAGITYAVQQRQVAELETRIEKLADRSQALESSLTAAEDSLAAQPVTPRPNATDKLEQPAENVVRTREFAFIKDVTYHGYDPKKRGRTAVAVIVADYAQFLTGKQAADAASAAGDESPPPNDYYIVNDNPKLRSLMVYAGEPKVRLTTNPDGTADPAGYETSVEAWANFFAAPSDENGAIRRAGYWLTLENGQVVAIEEQFVP